MPYMFVNGNARPHFDKLDFYPNQKRQIIVQQQKNCRNGNLFRFGFICKIKKIPAELVRKLCAKSCGNILPQKRSFFITCLCYLQVDRIFPFISRIVFFLLIISFSSWFIEANKGERTKIKKAEYPAAIMCWLLLWCEPKVDYETHKIPMKISVECMQARE